MPDAGDPSDPSSWSDPPAPPGGGWGPPQGPAPGGGHGSGGYGPGGYGPGGYGPGPSPAAKGTDAAFAGIVAAPEGGEFTVFVAVQVVGQADFEALDKVSETFTVTP